MDWEQSILHRLRERDGHSGGVREVVENCKSIASVY